MALRNLFTEVQLRDKQRRITADLLADADFQAELERIRLQFRIPQHPTANDRQAWYTQYFGSWEVLEQDFFDDRSRLRALDKCLEQLSMKYGLWPHLKVTLRHPFDVVVDEALAKLGLDSAWREFFISCLWGSPNYAPIPPSYGFKYSSDGSIRTITIRLTPYDSERDVLALLKRVKTWCGYRSKVRKARPAKIQDREHLRDYILAQVLPTPKACKGAQKALIQRLYQETLQVSLHTLALPGFRDFYFKMLKECGLTKQNEYYPRRQP
jgi:hypothetical protein